MKRTKKKALTITVCAAAAAGIAIMWAAVLKSGDNGGALPDSSSAIVSESSSADSGTADGVDITLKENVDIYQSHNYPELTDEDMITLAQLAENKEAYEDNIMSEDYGNIVFTARPDIFVPDEIGKYQIECVNEYLENAEDVIKFLVGETFDARYITDERKLDDPIHYPYCMNYDNLQRDEDGSATAGTFASVGNIGNVSYVEDWENRGLDDIIMQKAYFLKSDYEDKTYSLNENDISISQYASQVDNYLGNVLSMVGHEGSIGQFAIVAQKDIHGNMLLRSELANIYKSLPICVYYPTSGAAESECILKKSDETLSSQYAATTNGKIIEDLYIHSQFKDYKTIEEYDKIIAPDKAAKLLSESLAPNLQDNEIIGMGLSYYPYFVGSTQTEPLKEDANTKEETELTHREIAPWMQPVSYDVFELTPFWTFYFDLDPSIIGLVDCKTGEVAYIHNVTW